MSFTCFKKVSLLSWSVIC